MIIHAFAPRHRSIGERLHRRRVYDDLLARASLYGKRTANVLQCIPDIIFVYTYQRCTRLAHQTSPPGRTRVMIIIIIVCVYPMYWVAGVEGHKNYTSKTRGDVIGRESLYTNLLQRKPKTLYGEAEELI